MKLPTLWKTSSFLELMLPALTTMFALQTLRVLLPSFVWYLGDSVGIPYTMLGLVAIGTFVLSILVLPFDRGLGLRRALIVALAGIALTRLSEQFSTSPALDLVLAILGTVLFTFFIPLYLAYVRHRGELAPHEFGRGFLLGFAFDTTLHGLFHTLDLSWQNHPLASVIVVLAVLAQLWLTWRLPAMPESAEANFTSMLPLAALGPLIFVSQVVFQNVARATTLTGFPMPLAYAFIVLANAIGISAALLPSRASISFAVLVATGFLAWLTAYPDPPPGTAGLMFFVGNLLVFPFGTLLLAGVGSRAERNKGIVRSAMANTLGWLLFALLVLLYYISYDINVGIPNTWLPPFAILVLGVAVIATLRTTAHFPAAGSTTAATMAFALLLGPLLILANWREPQPIAGKGFPVRVMSYNVHNGFTTAGRLDLEAIAKTIEQVQPDVLGLQEVERGWYIDSSVDLLMWLARRLNLPYVYGPTADPVWGNAILSRYPIKHWDTQALPPPDLFLKRGLVWARIDLGNGDELLFIATHYHHVEEDTAIRQQQSLALIRFWNQRPRTVIVGDFNAEPASKEIGMLREAGLLDAVDLLGKGAQKTWPSDKPTQRLDYIWLSPDLKARDVQIPLSTASDHLGVAVTVEEKR